MAQTAWRRRRCGRGVESDINGKAELLRDVDLVGVHDLARADWVIDVGPGAGEAGGTIVATGTPEEVAQSDNSRTAVYLRSHLEERAR